MVGSAHHTDGQAGGRAPGICISRPWLVLVETIESGRLRLLCLHFGVVNVTPNNSSHNSAFLPYKERGFDRHIASPYIVS